jgi:uncharacterized protein (DUF433 family)
MTIIYILSTIYIMLRFDRIKVDPEVMNGQACIRDTRITVSLVLRLLAKHSMKEVLEMYPELEEEDIKQALEYTLTRMQ